MPKICGITTLPGTVKSFMLENLNFMSEHGYESFCISSPGNAIDAKCLGSVRYIPIKEMIWGYMGPISFIRCVFRLYSIFKKEKFDIIQYATANAAVCASIAGYLAKVPVRIYCEWGIGYPVFKGFKKWIYYFGTLLPCKLSTSVQPDSFGNPKFSIDEKLFPARKGQVIFNGSACGVDLNKFDIHRKEEWKHEIYEEYHLERYSKVLGYVGRIVVEKGINELMEAFLKMNKPDVCLFLVGPTQFINQVDQDKLKVIRKMDNVFITGPKNAPEKFYATFDYLLLPSYQEGFGMTILEAAAMGVPSIISNIKGPTDLIEDGNNGFVCEPRSANSLYEVINKACSLSEEDYSNMCQEAYKKSATLYDSAVFKQKFYENRVELLSVAQNK